MNMDWAFSHLSTITILCKLFFHGQRHKAHRCITKMHRQGTMKWIGFLKMKGVRAQDLYYNGPHEIPETLYVHEYLLTRFFAALHPHGEVIRNYDVDPDLRPDAELSLSGMVFNVELDTGSMRGLKRDGRFELYGDTGPVLWVCAGGAQRMENMRLQAPNDGHWFTTLDAVEASPWGKIWTNRQGHKENLAR